MAGTDAERRQVYLACKPIFTGSNASLRKLKNVQKQINLHQSSLHTLIPGFAADRVAVIAKYLLEKRVFESDVKAKKEFPDLFVSSSSREIWRDTFEIEAARSTAEALSEIASVYEGDDENREEDIPLQEEAHAEPEIPADQGTAPGDKPAKEPDLPVPSLYPLYSPYHMQHSILCTIQRVLEECFFDFTNKWMPAEIERNGWDCATAVELTKWTRLLPKWSAKLPEECLQLHGSELDTLLYTIRKIRHTAVHRLRTTARGIGELALSAMRLAEVLQDGARISQLEDLHLDIQGKIKAMELSQNALEEHLISALKAIQLQREELDRKEEELRMATVNSDRENRALVGFLIEKSVQRIFGDESDSGFTTADEGDDKLV